MKNRLRDRWAWLFSATWLLLGQAVAAETNTLVIPPDFEHKPGNALANGLTYGDREYQEVYAGSLFSAASTDILLITGIAFRLDESDPDSGSLDVVIPKVEIHASTHFGTIPEMSPLNTENWGSDRKRVFYAENLPVSASRTSSDLSNFQVKFVFDTPFSFDRRAGNLLFDFKSVHQEFGADFAMTDFSNIGANFNSAILFGGSRPILGVGDILQISYVPVPEPKFLKLYLICGIFLLIIRYSRLV